MNGPVLVSQLSPGSNSTKRSGSLGNRPPRQRSQPSSRSLYTPGQDVNTFCTSPSCASRTHRSKRNSEFSDDNTLDTVRPDDDIRTQGSANNVLQKYKGIGVANAGITVSGAKEEGTTCSCTDGVANKSRIDEVNRGPNSSAVRLTTS